MYQQTEVTSATRRNKKPGHAPETSAPALKPSGFSTLGLAEPIQQGLQKNGFKTPTDIQARSIPVALEGRDVLASAQTGTGKTAAFVVPALQLLLTPSSQKGGGPRVLILTPTRELAGQVESVIRDLGHYTNLRTGIIVGGVSYGPQERLLRRGVDLLVATPGRLMDHMKSGLVDFSRLEMFVLDEADRMLDMGFIKPVQIISAALPEVRQTLLFSATLEGEVMKIAKRLLKDPERIHLSPARQRNQAITQNLYSAKDPEHKHRLLSHFLTDPSVNQAIVFTATKRGADKLAKRLTAGGLTCASLHGNMRQNARMKTVDMLRRGKVQILVATDVAARGIDVEGVSHVINFDLPTVAEDYIHRIGRTGRNGASGTAISIVSAQDKVKLNNIERLTGHRIDRPALTELRPMAEPIRFQSPAVGNDGAPAQHARRSAEGRPEATRPVGERKKPFRRTRKPNPAAGERVGMRPRKPVRNGGHGQRRASGA